LRELLWVTLLDKEALIIQDQVVLYSEAVDYTSIITANHRLV